MGGRESSSGKAMSTRKGETKEDAAKRYEGKDSEAKLKIEQNREKMQSRGIKIKSMEEVEKQAPTKSRIIELMNEPQIDNEIQAQINVINRLTGDNTYSWENIGLIPITQTQRGMSQGQRDSKAEKMLSVATKTAKNVAERTRAENYLNKLIQAKKTVIGTGLTQREIFKQTDKIRKNKK